MKHDTEFSQPMRDLKREINSICTRYGFSQVDKTQAPTGWKTDAGTPYVVWDCGAKVKEEGAPTAILGASPEVLVPFLIANLRDAAERAASRGCTAMVFRRYPEFSRMSLEGAEALYYRLTVRLAFE